MSHSKEPVQRLGGYCDWLHSDNVDSPPICNAVLEKEARLNGTWQESNEDKLLQERFWEIFKSHSNFQKYHGDIHPEARVGAHFLRNNPEWLN